MEKYGILKEVGHGASGIVFKAVNRQTGEVVAIKKLNKKYKPWEEGIILREINAHMMMNYHPNIVTLKDTIKEHDDTLFLVYEYMPCSLYQYLTERKRVFLSFSEIEIQAYCFQVFQVLAQMHQKGYFHCDLKPENLLLKNNIIKIDDLGQAREANGQRPYSYISKLWYRAPEVLLQSPNCYSYAIDMWAMGAVMIELLTLQPIFLGDSPVNVLSKMWNVLGTPTESAWSRESDLANRTNNQFPNLGVPFSQLLPDAGPNLVNLIATLLSWDPSHRPTADQALEHAFFHGGYPSPLAEPFVFRMARQREESRNIRRNLQHFTSVPQRVVSIEEQISMLPENPFDM